ncbi:glycosyltransferase [Candidatus Woesearchaeota archaeon]|nr:glycosyltransferase [Candidatus Woesearchaeota archaeon]
MKKISVLIPCFNEEKGIANVIKDIPKHKLKALGYEVDVFVIDNNCSDKTSGIARDNGAEIIHEPRQGKGNAIITGFKNLPKDTDIVVMLDGDNSYKSHEMLRLIEPIDNKFCDVVIGTRLSGKMHDDSMTFLNRAGNWLLTFLVRVAYHGNVTDVCSGYFAWNKKVIDMMLPHLKSNGFSIEMEMITKMARMDFEIYSIPITYEKREGTSSLDPINDGLKIMYTWGRNLTLKSEKLSA